MLSRCFSASHSIQGIRGNSLSLTQLNREEACQRLFFKWLGQGIYRKTQKMWCDGMIESYLQTQTLYITYVSLTWSMKLVNPKQFRGLCSSLLLLPHGYSLDHDTKALSMSVWSSWGVGHPSFKQHKMSALIIFSLQLFSYWFCWHDC